jgi:hypothetical protein
VLVDIGLTRARGQGADVVKPQLQALSDTVTTHAHASLHGFNLVAESIARALPK